MTQKTIHTFTEEIHHENSTRQVTMFHQLLT